MTTAEILEIVARQLSAEARFLEALSSFPSILAERRRELEASEEELAAVLTEVLCAHDCTASGRPPDSAGFPD